MLSDEDVVAGKRLVRSAAEHGGSVCRVAVGILLPASRGVALITLVAVFILVSRRQSRLALAEVAVGVLLGLCFHPRAATVVGSVLIVTGATVTHGNRINVTEPEPPPAKEEPPPSLDLLSKLPESTVVDLVL